jgi:hypothetical protein
MTEFVVCHQVMMSKIRKGQNIEEIKIVTSKNRLTNTTQPNDQAQHNHNGKQHKKLILNFGLSATSEDRLDVQESLSILNYGFWIKEGVHADPGNPNKLRRLIPALCFLPEQEASMLGHWGVSRHAPTCLQSQQTH